MGVPSTIDDVAERSVSSTEAAPRAFAFQMLGRLLLAPPDAALLAGLAALSVSPDSSEGVFAPRWAALSAAASATDVARVDQEYSDLFIGLGRGQVVPYGSWYVTGFLMDRPLAELRADLARLGFERDAAASEPEDHIGALCEVMAMLVDGADGPGATDSGFYQSHIGPWARAFFSDLGAAPAASFYQSVAALGVALTDFEAEYQRMLR